MKWSDTWHVLQKKIWEAWQGKWVGVLTKTGHSRNWGWRWALEGSFYNPLISLKFSVIKHILIDIYFFTLCSMLSVFSQFFICLLTLMSFLLGAVSFLKKVYYWLTVSMRFISQKSDTRVSLTPLPPLLAPPSPLIRMISLTGFELVLSDCKEG